MASLEAEVINFLKFQKAITNLFVVIFAKCLSISKTTCAFGKLGMQPGKEGMFLIEIGKRTPLHYTAGGKAIITIVVLTFFDVYNEYMFALTLVTSQNKWLGTVGLAANTTRMGTSWNVMLTQTALFCIPPILFYFIFQRYIVKGLSEGALKF